MDNRLTLLNETGHRNSYGAFTGIFQCSCGNIVERILYLVKSNRTKSCGCLKSELASIGKYATKHGKYNTPEYMAWSQLKQRCLNTRCKDYPSYGGRGIAVCDQWRDNFEQFLQDVGVRPSKQHSLDRTDNNKGYEPSNCRWATITEQNQNRRVVSDLENKLARYEQIFGPLHD